MEHRQVGRPGAGEKECEEMTTKEALVRSSPSTLVLLGQSLQAKAPESSGLQPSPTLDSSMRLETPGS